MKKTVSQLLRLRSSVFLVLGAAGFAYVMAGFCLKASELFIFLSLIITGFIILYSIFSHFNILIRERLTYLAVSLMDAELLEKESRQVYSPKSGSMKNRFGWYYYEAVRLSILGDFDGALSACKEMPADASGLAQKITALSKVNKYRLGCGKLLGTYYLETGDTQKAREFLSNTLKEARENSGMLGAHFDFARLEEKEGNLEKAMAHYRQAAAIGPKTWLGQEAGRRLEALTGLARENIVC